MANSTITGRKAQKTKGRKPKSADAQAEKPYDGFPLFVHQTGGADKRESWRWCKKFKGRFHYFGRVIDGWEPALDLYDRQKHDLHAGRVPRASKPTTSDGLKLDDLFNRFLAAMERRVELGELNKATFDDYNRTCRLILKHLGVYRLVNDILPDDWADLLVAVSKGKGAKGKKPRPWGPVTKADFVTRAKVPFAWALKNKLISAPMAFGTEFRKPPAEKIEAHKHEQPAKLFKRDEVLALLKAAPQPLKSMIWLGVNAGFGNGDNASLPLKALDLQSGWVSFPRPKTAVPRRCPLWKETREALQEWLAMRPEPASAEYAGLVFLRPDGRPWSSQTNDNPISNKFSDLVKSLKLEQSGRGFYSLRHTFRTEADGVLDSPAIDLVMGHKSGGMGAHYRHRIDDARLQKVAGHVRAWLFPRGRRQE